MAKANTNKGSLNTIRREIQKSHLILIIVITFFLSFGGVAVNVNATDKALDQSLQNTANLISRIYSFTKNLPEEEFTENFNSVCNELGDVDVISIVNTENIRLYHTKNFLIGTEYLGHFPDFSKHPSGFYTAENENGPSGPQRRTYYAIYDESGNYSGFIMAIILKTSIRIASLRTIALFLAVTICAVLIEIAISKTFSKRIKQKLLGYEPGTFSSMFKIRDNILESINDGIIAIDSDTKVQFINKAAQEILKSKGPDEKINRIKENVFADKFLVPALETGKTSFGLQEKMEDGTEVLIDILQIKEDEEIRGTVAILHDRSEYTKLMEDLSGTKYLVDSMRANNHDFTNKLHVILGLIQIGQYQKAISYIENITLIQRETLSMVMHSIENPSVAALLIGKIARASECNVKFILKEGIHFKASHIQIPSEALVTIIGNLIDNAFDSMYQQSYFDSDANELVFGIFSQEKELLITVDDTGCGIPDEIKAKVFENGFSTKGEGRGIGLFHTKQLVESLGGKIYFESQEKVGTSFMVSFKNK